MHRDISKHCCMNVECSEYGKRGAGNLSYCGWSGSGKKIRMIRCRVCEHRFSERKGTPLFHSRLPEAKAEDVLNHIKEGCGTRQTERLVGVHRDTVTRLTRKAGKHAKGLHDELVAFSSNDK